MDVKCPLAGWVHALQLAWKVSAPIMVTVTGSSECAFHTPPSEHGGAGDAQQREASARTTAPERREEAAAKGAIAKAENRKRGEGGARQREKELTA